jgi:hypothetical protein
MPQIYKPHTTSVTVLGETYTADENGIIDIPDDKFSPTVFSQGFVSAIGRINQLAREASTVTHDVELPEPVQVIAEPAVIKATTPVSEPLPIATPIPPKKSIGDSSNV